ncbi:matrixin family metalloprotease [Streptomyces sp. NBC_01275]|uniref:matrixin family metalloprotease n=1 Tax=Streptomyces sp. NBC_01275 TaxID=2903807 RepID=UPI002258F09F|nr:matrixin family metalloprotease [Streptomyces sp. NBC_01275]MCX4765039.1 matrixin family metalloprotease [Streptomyces sp. NBC_01275]
MLIRATIKFRATSERSTGPEGGGVVRRSGSGGGLLGRTVTASVLVAALAAAGGGAPSRAGRSSAPAPACALAPGELTVDDLPAGASVLDCAAVGRLVTHDGAGLTVPEPGTAVRVDALTTDGSAHGFTLTVAADGTVSYSYDDGHDDGQPSAGAPHAPHALLSASAPGTRADAPAACADSAYTTVDSKEYGTYEWFIGDGPQPGDLPRREVRQIFEEAIATITGARNSCGFADPVAAKARFLAATGNEAGIDHMARCTARDGMSVWDAGDLSTVAVATTCTWSRPVPGGPDRLLEADVRFNTHDYTFTNDPAGTGCANDYDIRGVATHEAGHVFGLGHAGARHENLTMFANSFPCSMSARTLGKGDVLGLRSLYRR